MPSTCTIHGCPTVSLGNKIYCPACVACVSAPLVGAYAQARSQISRFELEARASMSGIPDIFAQADFDSFVIDSPRAAQVVQALKNYAIQFSERRTGRSGFVLVGPTGVGKTHLACAMCLEIMSQGFSARYMSLPRLTFQIRRTYKSQDAQDTTAGVIADLVGCDFLVLDEIDLHGASDSDYQVLYEIINGRYESGRKPTVVLSNRSAEDLTADLHERVMSRILCGTNPIVCNWTGRRGARRQPAEHIANQLTPQA